MLCSSYWHTTRVPALCEAYSGTQSGLGGATLVAATLPFHAQRAVVLLVAVALLGIFCGVAFGSRYSAAARGTVDIEQLVGNQVASKSEASARLACACTSGCCVNLLMFIMWRVQQLPARIPLQCPRVCGTHHRWVGFLAASLHRHGHPA